MECGSCYRDDGPEDERSLGETAYVVAQAARAAESGRAPPILGMVGNVELRLGARLDAVLDLHLDLAGDFFKGVRQAGASAKFEERDLLLIPGGADPDLYLQSEFQAGVRRLGERGLSCDTWHYHYQMQDFIALARACPDTTLVLDHFGTPLGIGHYGAQREAVFDAWRADMEALARCPNVVLKLGGLAMPDNGYGWHLAERPPTSDEVLDAQGRWYHHALDCFGAERCMFESNFPVDRLSLSYTVYFNAMKKLTASRPAAERAALFHGTAQRVYRLPPVT
jgi:predicted TIM-barrel fold metal-dependent hydrolase